MQKQIVIVLVMLFGFNELSWADFPPQRRRDQYPANFGYFIYPIVTRIPGLGTASGAGATFVNVAESDTDLTGFYIDGDFQAGGLTALNNHLIPRRLIFDVGVYNYNVAQRQYGRGLDSDKDDFIYPEVEGAGATSQMTLTFLDRRLDFYTRLGINKNQVNRVYDSNFNEFQNIDKQEETSRYLSLGMNIDLTDDRQDPRRGVRFEAFRRERLDDVDPALSTFTVYDANLTLYFPVGEKDTWVWNIYRSRAKLTRQGITDYGALQERYGFNCAGIASVIGRENCEAAENQYLTSLQSQNRYGTATPLGGTQRLRSFNGGRFLAANTLFIGTEYRWNLTEEYTPINWFILRGHRTNFQLALFAEAGSVAEQASDLTDKFKYSYGTGFRMLFEGVTIRADLANGDEGSETQIFIDYPFSLYSVDSPG